MLDGRSSNRVSQPSVAVPLSRLPRCLLLLIAVGVSPIEAADVEYAIAVHGGAGGWAGRSDEDRAAMLADLTAALTVGRDLLAAGGASVDAVERVIVLLEDSPWFNAGKGAVFNAVGERQLDASIMRGDDLQAGAVAAIGVAKNPIRVARRVMTDTRHVLLAGRGADEFAREIGADLVEPDYFWTPATRAAFDEYRKRTSGSPPRVDHYGTVGCVALDHNGDLAAGTSTGGLEGKRVGRVGDSPLVAAGTYADNRSAAVSCTGVGELFIRNAIAYDIAARVRYRVSDLPTAVAHHLEVRLAPGTGGVIAVSAAGEVVTAFNTTAMPRGVADSEGRFEVAIGERGR